MAQDKQDVSPTVAMWIEEIQTYEQKFLDWENRGKKIVKRYKNERKDAEKSNARFNILWSNVQTLHPAIYANPPTPNIDRRFQDEDDLGRYAAFVLERAVSYYVKNDLFDKVMKQASLDRLLPGRGVAWVRYCPVFEEKAQVTDDEENKEYDQPDELMAEDVVPDYVHWCDFGHTWARTWQEVRGVWRRVCMSRAELVKRFGEEKGTQIPLDAVLATAADGEKIGVGKKAWIYEIWDKSKKKAIWLHKAMPEVLDELDDPLGLKDFFPCPEPIYATLANDDLIPTPDYVQYQDQAIELGMITARITAITQAVKVAGVYDASAEGIDRLLSEGVENKLIPISQFAVLGQGKGLEGAISFLPLEKILATLQGLYQIREQVKQDLYEITGISDIVRGATKANETATAQQIKGQFATLRLDSGQKDVARFSKDLVVIMTEVIAKHFSLETIKAVSGVKLLTNEEKQQVQMQQQMAQAAQEGMPQHPAIPEEILELAALPSWEDIEQLIRNDTARCFRIDIETDSTIKTDQDNEKQSRIEFLGAVSSFMQQAVNVPPQLMPLAMELLMFGVRGFKVSRELETSFESTISKMQKAAENPEPPQPSPEEMKAKAEMQRSQAEMQIEQMRQQGQMQQLQAKAQADQQKTQADLMLKQADIELKKLDLQLKTLDMQNKQQQLSIGLKDAGEVQQTNALLDAVLQGNQALIQAVQNPPARQVIRDEQGNIIGVK